MDTLKKLTGGLITSFLPAATRNRSFFVNNIPDQLTIAHNREWIASVISGLLKAVVNHARETCIQLSARKYGENIVLEIQESGCISTYAMACGLQDVQSMAEKIGGNLNISIRKPTCTMIAFSFPSLQVAA